MKAIHLLAGIAIVCSVSCKKTLTPLAAKNPATTSVAISTTSTSVENLGAPIKGSTLLLKINPSFENLEPLITYAPNSNSGYVALVIDNGNKGTTPFKFLAVDMVRNTSKTIYVKDRNGVQVTQTLGRVSRTMYGMNKKYYVATENGGHLVEYDPNTQTALDLGQPFNINGRVLDIYSLSVGSDGALYGGSFGSDGDVYTFRYDYNNNFYVDKTNLDDDAKYVTYVSGDKDYTYASCGQNSWKLYAIQRSTGNKKVLLQSNNPADRIYLTTHADACYSTTLGKGYKLNGFTATPATAADLAISKEPYYLPYLPSATLPKIAWSECDKKLYYKFPTGTEQSVTLNDVTDEVYSVGAMTAVDNKLILSGGKIARAVMYDRQAGFVCLGTPSTSAYVMTVVPGTNNSKIMMGGYPKGSINEYNITKAWTMGTETIAYTPPAVTSTQSNPTNIALMQDPDSKGVYGPMTINNILYTKDGTLVAAGNNDRLTTTSSREVSIGTVKNGVKRNFYTAEFSSYEFRNMCLSKDSSEVFISAVSKYGTDGKIFRYNPASNSITSTIPFNVKDPGAVSLYSDNLLIGSYDDVLYLLDVNTKAIVYRKVLGSGQRIHTLTVAPDHSVWVDHAYLNVSITKLIKFDFNTTDIKAITATTSDISVIKNPEATEGSLPTSLVFLKSGINNYDLYISGYNSLLRMSNACATNL